MAIFSTIPLRHIASCADTRPKRSSKVEQGPKTSLPENVCFNGRLESRHSTEDGSEYLHFVFGGQNSLDGGVACRNIGIIDAEFIFLSGACQLSKTYQHNIMTSCILLCVC